LPHPLTEAAAAERLDAQGKKNTQVKAGFHRVHKVRRALIRVIIQARTRPDLAFFHGQRKRAWRRIGGEFQRVKG
jgi:hypothetical protein